MSEMREEIRSIFEVYPYENNPRIIEAGVKAVKESIKQCGYVAPIIVDEGGVILAGHTRYAAVDELGYDTVPVIVVPGLTEDQKRKFRLLDNKTNEYAEWDLEMVKKELQGLDLGEFHDFDFLFTDKEKSEIASVVDGPVESQEDEDENDDPAGAAVYCPKCGSLVDDGGML